MGSQLKIFALDFCFFGDFPRVDEIKLQLRLEVDQVDFFGDVGEVDVVVGIQVDQVDGGVDDYVDVVVAFEVDQVDGVGGKRV